MFKIYNHKSTSSKIENKILENVLGREIMDVKFPEITPDINKKVVLVTGAGGSIGSEICIQLTRFNPEKIILVDISENNLLSIEQKLSEKFSFKKTVPIIADICNNEIMKRVLKRYKPYILFHAAAYKHVPLMQINPESTMQNNFLGTVKIANISIDFGVKKFVMLSTNKAVNPVSVMGLSKLLSEKYLSTLSKVKNTRFIVVRFGNVMGSKGSVIKIFKKQIESGGPLTLTHKEMKRYFITKTEAAQLIIQSCIIGKGGEVYILDMGRQVNILDIAINMIEFYKLKPKKDIKIIYIGVKNGEKIIEELYDKDEKLTPTVCKHIFKTKNIYKKNKSKQMLNILSRIEKEIEVYDYNNLFKDLNSIIPGFDRKTMWLSKYK